MAPMRRSYLTPLILFFKKEEKKKGLQQHETFRFGSSCQSSSPCSLHYGTSNMIQLTASLELTC